MGGAFMTGSVRALSLVASLFSLLQDIEQFPVGLFIFKDEGQNVRVRSGKQA